jgi:hypothetical protein
LYVTYADFSPSILYKTKLPFILVFNKTDVQSHQFALDWMSDFEEFQSALASHEGTRDSEGGPTYMNSLMNSMCLVLDEFYKNLKVGCVTICIEKCRADRRSIVSIS